jgi:hypothetical protein
VPEPASAAARWYITETPSDGNDREARYQLPDVFAAGGLWAQRANADLFAHLGTFAGDCGTGTWSCGINSANAPWGWDDADDQVVTDPGTRPRRPKIPYGVRCWRPRRRAACARPAPAVYSDAPCGPPGQLPDGAPVSLAPGRVGHVGPGGGMADALA